MKRIFKNLMLIGFAATLCVACDKEEDDVNGIIAKGTFSVAQGKKVGRMFTLDVKVPEINATMFA